MTKSLSRRVASVPINIIDYLTPWETEQDNSTQGLTWSPHSSLSTRVIHLMGLFDTCRSRSDEDAQLVGSPNL